MVTIQAVVVVVVTMEAYVSTMPPISHSEALCWLERAIRQSIARSERLNVKDQEERTLRLAVDVHAADCKLRSMLKDFKCDERRRANLLLNHAWATEAVELATTDPRAAHFHHDVVKEAWVIITAGRPLQKKKQQQKQQPR